LWEGGVVISDLFLIQTTPISSDIQVGTIGLKIELGLRERYDVLNVSSASPINIIIEKPDNSKTTYPASFLTDGTDGVIYYTTTTTGDLDQAGTYSIQAYMEMSGFKGYSTVSVFEVHANL
jgi:hypothetical protein